MPIDVSGFDFGRGATQEAAGFTNLLQQGQQVQARDLALGQQRAQIGRESQVRQALGGLQQPEFAPQTQQQQQLAEQTAGLGGALAQAEQPQPIKSQEEKIRIARGIDPAIANRVLRDMGLDDVSKRAEMSRFAADLEATPFEMRPEKIMARSEKLRAEGRNSTETDKLLDLDEQAQNKGLLGIQLMDLTTKERLGVQAAATRGLEKPAGQREFEALTETLTEQQKKEAALIKLGLSPRAVGSAIQTISSEGIAEEIGKSSEIIAQRKKFGEMTGASRSKAIDKGFEKIVKIDLGIRNLDRAIEAIDAGASTGVLQQFSPSIRASSVALDQVRNTLALDVLNSATFGALSEKELELVKETALPTKLRSAELRQWVVDRKAAEQKLRAYYQEQINWLDKGGTVASFLREKERELTQQSAATPPPPPPGFVIEGQ